MRGSSGNVADVAKRTFGRQLNSDPAEMLFRCPKCKRPKLYANPRKGTFYCVRCEYTGNIMLEAGEHYDPDAVPSDDPVLTISPPTLEQVHATPIHSKHLIEYLVNRKFTLDQIQEMGVCESQFCGEVFLPVLNESDETISTVRKWIKSLVGGVIFPIYDNGYRGYQVRYTLAKGKDMRWMTAPGVRRRELIYNADTALSPEHDRVYVAEGIPAACAFWPNGIATFGKGFSLQQLNRICRAPQRMIYVAYDGDAQDKAHELGNALQDIGKDVRVIKFGYFPAADGSSPVTEDPDSISDLRSRIEQAEPPTSYVEMDSMQLYASYRKATLHPHRPRRPSRLYDRASSFAPSPWQRY